MFHINRILFIIKLCSLDYGVNIPENRSLKIVDKNHIFPLTAPANQKTEFQS